MNNKVHNHSHLDFKKTQKTVDFFSRSIFKRFEDSNKWDMEVWLDENSKNLKNHFSCGVTLRRPRRAPLYVRKASDSMDKAVKNALSTLAQVVQTRKASWKPNQLH